MATMKFYLDRRFPGKDGACPLKIAVGTPKETAYINTRIKLMPEHWDNETQRVLGRSDRVFVNRALVKMFDKAYEDLEKIMRTAKGRKMGAKELRDALEGKMGDRAEGGADSFARRLVSFAERHSPRTRDLYLNTLSRIRAFCPEVASLTFEDIDKGWLQEFESFLARTAKSKNARNIHLRNIRAVFNDALDDEITTAYPFRKFKIRPVATRKRAMALEDLRELLTMEVVPWQEFYRDMFKLIFLLIGINAVDLYGLTRVTRQGRVEYERAKTHRAYSVKVEPEAMELIEKWRGQKGLLCLADRWGDHRNFLHQCNKALKSIGEVKRVGLGGRKVTEAYFPEVTTYWARHSWATVAASLDIPKETIAHALGHGSQTVTDIYIDFDERKVDEANRRVIDWVLYGKR